MNTKIILLKYAVLEARTIFFLKSTYFSELKKIVLAHRSLCVKNVIFLKFALVFSENLRNYSKMAKKYQKWLKID